MFKELTVEVYTVECGYVKQRYDKLMKSVKYYVGAGCERPIEPAPRSVPAPPPPAPRSTPLHRFSPTPAHRSAPLHPIFGSLRSVFRSAHAPLTCSVTQRKYYRYYALFVWAIRKCNRCPVYSVWCSCYYLLLLLLSIFESTLSQDATNALKRTVTR